MLRGRLLVATLSLGLAACDGGAEAPQASGAGKDRRQAAVATAAERRARGSLEQAAKPPTPTLVGCTEHVEPTVERFDRRRDITRGPFALVTVARDIPTLSRAPTALVVVGCRA